MIKDETPLQEKQYYVLVSYKPEKWKKGQIISISQEIAQAYIGSRILTPLKTALAKDQYVPKIEIATYVKPKPEPRSSTTAPVEKPKKEKPKKKTLIKNSLRSAVQEKKEVITEPESKDEPIEEPKNEPTEEPKDEPTPSSSAAEDAIKKKIAAAKKSKK